MKLSVMFVFLFVATQTRAQKCPELKQKMDKCIRESLVVGDYGFTAPKSIRGMDSFCRSRRRIKCLTAYKPCLKPFPKQLFSIVINGFKNLLKSSCSDAGKAELFEALRCINPTNIETVHQIMEKSTLIYKYISDNSTDDGLIPAMCCGYHRMLQIIRNTFKKICFPAETDPKIPLTWENSMITAYGDAIGLTCGQFSDGPACRQRLPHLMAQFKTIVEGTVKRQEFTFISYLMDIADRLTN